MKYRTARIALPLVIMLSACSTTPPTSNSTSTTPLPTQRQDASVTYFRLDEPEHANEIVMFAMGLLDVGYRFGGKNPEAGLDCSGMVSYVVEQVSGQKLPHNAAKIAALTRPVTRQELKPADLVFFNTNGQPYSHMGIYLGDGRFVHAPSSKGSVRVEKIDGAYFAKRFTAGRTLF